MARHRYKRLNRVPRLVPRRKYLSIAGGDWPSLEPLRPVWGTLRGLVVHWPVEDISGISAMTSLEELDVSEYASGSFSLAGLSSLTDLSLQVGPERPIVPEGDTVRELWLCRATKPWAEWIETLTKLRCLRLDQPRALPTLLPASLRELDIGLKTNGIPMMQGPAGLELLSLTSVRGLRDLSAFGFAQNLKRLWIEDCDELESLEGVGLAPGAEVLTIGRNSLSN